MASLASLREKLHKRKLERAHLTDGQEHDDVTGTITTSYTQRCHPSFIQRNSYIFNTCLNKKKHHRSIHNIRLQMIIDNQVFEFSNICTVGASIRVVTV